MTPDQTIAEAGLELARKLIAARDAEGKVARLRLNEACEQAREIIDFDHARRAVVIEGPWVKRPNPDQPQGAA